MPKYYLLDDNKNLIEGFDKEGFLALLQQAIASGSLDNIDEESAVASKLRSVLNGTTHHIEFVTQAQYNQLVADDELVPNTYYFITDDTSYEGLVSRIDSLESELQDGIDAVSAKCKEVYLDTTASYGNETALLTGANDFFSQATYQDKATALFEYDASLTERVEGGTDIVYKYKIHKIDTNKYFVMVSNTSTDEAWMEIAVFGHSALEVEKLVTASELTTATTAQEIDPSWNITQKGLYAVNWTDTSIDFTFTSMLSITNLSANVVQGSECKYTSNKSIHAKYISTNVFNRHIYFEGISDTAGVLTEPTSIKLIMKY